MIIMKSEMISYTIDSNSIIITYDVVNKKFLVEEEYRDRDIGIKMGFSYSVKSREGVRESLNRFKKSFNNKYQPKRKDIFPTIFLL